MLPAGSPYTVKTTGYLRFGLNPLGFVNQASRLTPSAVVICKKVMSKSVTAFSNWESMDFAGSNGVFVGKFNHSVVGRVFAFEKLCLANFPFGLIS